VDGRDKPYDMHTSPKRSCGSFHFSEIDDGSARVWEQRDGRPVWDGSATGGLEKRGAGFAGPFGLCRPIWHQPYVRVGGQTAPARMRILRAFLRNPRVRPDEMVATARAAPPLGWSRGAHILAIQDTTTLRDDGEKCSLNLHPMIAVDADDGGLLGLVDAVFLSHIGGKKHLCAKRPFAEKERAAAGLTRQNTAARPGRGRSGLRHRRRRPGRRYL